MSTNNVVLDVNASQADGLACIVCGAEYLRVAVPHMPAGWSVNGSQGFTCTNCPTEPIGRVGDPR